ncbi:metallophosphoesterase [bacterium]|nr:metallophosphoesterase [bacterium]
MPNHDKQSHTFAIITDIHGNIHALNRAIELIDENQKVDSIICLGDNFSLGAAPYQVLQKLKSLKNIMFIRGNHDRYLVERIWEYERPTIEGMDPDDPVCIGIVANEKWTAEQIGDEGKEFILNMRLSYFERIQSTYIEFTHAWFGRDELPPTMEEARKWRNHEQEKHARAKRFIFIHGHTHLPRNDQFGSLSVLCQGSTGLPFDEDKHGSVAFLEIEGDAVDWDVRRFDYDYEGALNLMNEVQPPFYKNLHSTLVHAGIRNDLVE